LYFSVWQMEMEENKQGKVIGAVTDGRDVINEVGGIYDAALGFYQKLDGAAEFKERHRSLELVIVNATHEMLEFDSEYFDTGAWFYHPEPLRIHPGDVSILFVASKAGSFATGVTGGLKYRIGCTGKALFMGFCNPHIGSYKTFVAVDDQSQSAKWAYDECSDDSVKVRENDHGFRLTTRMREPKQSPYKLFEYTIKNV
jgi:hypothetical protein